MNRIDHHPSPLPSNGADGGPLQRRVLQTLERQWLDSWGLAHAAQAGTGSTPPSRESVTSASPPADPARSPSTPSQSIPTSATPPANDVRAQGAATKADIDAERRGRGSHHQEQVARTVRQPMPVSHDSGALTRSLAVEAFAQTASSWSGLPAARTAAFTTSPSGQVLLLPPAALGGVGLAAVPIQPGLLADGELHDTGKSAAPPGRVSSPEPDQGAQKLTLREITADQVLATLRDSQLDAAASQLAAQGLARALMEAGYAQVRVVVNGRHDRGEVSDAADGAAPGGVTSQPTDTFPETAPKDRIHGN